jgi:MbtH protein
MRIGILQNAHRQVATSPSAGPKRLGNGGDVPGTSAEHTSQRTAGRGAGQPRGPYGRPERANRNEVAVTNPFEDADAPYRVLVNDEGQYSLWPADIAVPDGWVTAHDTDSRSNCLDYVEEHWTDMRPLSLVRAEGRERGGAADGG